MDAQPVRTRQRGVLLAASPFLVDDIAQVISLERGTVFGLNRLLSYSTPGANRALDFRPGLRLVCAHQSGELFWLRLSILALIGYA